MIGPLGFLLSHLSCGACIGYDEVTIMGSGVDLEQGAKLLAPEVACEEFLFGLKGKDTSTKQGPGGTC